MRYNIAENEWSTLNLRPGSNSATAELAYVSLPGLTGIYLIQGEEGEAFLRYVTAEPSQTCRSASPPACPARPSATRSPTRSACRTKDRAERWCNRQRSAAEQRRHRLSNGHPGQLLGYDAITVKLGTLAKSASTTITVVGVATAAGMATNTATVSSGNPRPGVGEQQREREHGRERTGHDQRSGVAGARPLAECPPASSRDVDRRSSRRRS